MFKIGDKAKGFKFNGGTDGVHYDNEMDDYVGVVGEVAEVYSDSFVIMFPDHLEWMYPASLWNLAKVEETQPFKIGDRVKFKKSSIDSGMIDATEDDVFNISHVAPISKAVWIEEHLGWWSTEHIEHVKEEIMNNTEEQKIKWEVGQEVWCTILGKGVIDNISNQGVQPITATFEGGKQTYTSQGEIFSIVKCNRSLFFSEPVITAELYPPKKPFVPTLKEGDEVLIEGPRGGQIFRREVKEETEDKVICKYAGEFEKIGYKFTKLGEEIIFN